MTTIIDTIKINSGTDLTRQEEIENAFREKLAIATSKKIDTKMTDCDKILFVMVNNPKKIWWFPYEFLGLHKTSFGTEFFIGYEASARLSELGRNTDMIESRQCGRFVARRYRFENARKTHNPIETPDEHIKRINNEI